MCNVVKSLDSPLEIIPRVNKINKSNVRVSFYTNVNGSMFLYTVIMFNQASP